MTSLSLTPFPPSLLSPTRAGVILPSEHAAHEATMPARGRSARSHTGAGR